MMTVSSAEDEAYTMRPIYWSQQQSRKGIDNGPEEYKMLTEALAE